MPKKCKSNESFGSSGERSRNTWATCPEAGDNRPKGLLIPHMIPLGIESIKVFGHFRMGPRPISLLVG